MNGIKKNGEKGRGEIGAESRKEMPAVDSWASIWVRSYVLGIATFAMSSHTTGFLRSFRSLKLIHLNLAKVVEQQQQQHK